MHDSTQLGERWCLDQATGNIERVPIDGD